MKIDDGRSIGNPAKHPKSKGSIPIEYGGPFPDKDAATQWGHVHLPDETEMPHQPLSADEFDLLNDALGG